MIFIYSLYEYDGVTWVNTLDEKSSDFISLLKIISDSGHGDISKSEYGIANILWPEWKPASVWDTFKDIYEL